MSDDNTIELNRRRVLGGVVTIGAAAAAAGAGTFAAFSDTESSNGSLTAGTLDLTQSNSLSFSASNITPGQSGSDFVTLDKSGTVAGDLAVEVTGVTSNEGAVEDAGGGSLADQVELTLWVDEDQDGSANNNDVGLNSDSTFTSSGSKGTADYATNFDGAVWNTTDGSSPAFISNFSGPVNFYVEWKFVDDTTGPSFDNDDAQGDDLSVDFQFTLTQQ